MNTTCKRLLVPGALASLAATALISAAQDGSGGNNVPGLSGQPSQSSVPGTLAGGASHTLVVLSPTGSSMNAFRVTAPSFSSVLIGTYGVNRGSGLSRQPGTRNMFVSGGMNDGGNLYVSAGGSTQTLVGATGWTSVPGLAFDSGGALWGSAAVSIIGDGLISINPATGAGTLVGGYGGPGGVDAIAHNPADGTMYGSTGFFYDGSPGDVITINTATGLGTDTGIDMSPLPPTVVGGMAFASDGQGYITIGAGDGGVWEYDTSGHTISFVGDVAGSSATDCEVIN